MTLYGKIKKFIIGGFTSLVGAVVSALDVRDFLFFGGLAMMGYGLYLFHPWVAFTVCGALLMLVGYAIRGGKP